MVAAPYGQAIVTVCIETPRQQRQLLEIRPVFHDNCRGRLLWF